MKLIKNNTTVAGFTLLEAILAMSIVALVAVQVTSAMRQHVTSSERVQLTTLAHWVAMNKLAQLQVAQQWPNLGIKKERVEMAQRKWEVVTKVTKSAVSGFRLVNIEVGLIIEISSEEVTNYRKLTFLFADKE